MHTFLQRFAGAVIGVLHGFDRVRFRGTKRLLMHVGGMLSSLWQRQVKLKDFAQHAQAMTATLKQGIEQQAQTLGRPLVYVHRGKVSLEALAQEIAQRDGIREGLVCVLSRVEACSSDAVHPNRETKQLDLRKSPKKCLHSYHYLLDPQLGWLHTRLQSWYPFALQVCLNGREWLGRQLDRAGIRYRRRDNCFVDVADLAAAQALLQEQLRTDWPALLDRLAAFSNPNALAMFPGRDVPYYWSVEESAWATDVLFRSRAELARWYPYWRRHGLETLRSAEVLRFLGRAGTPQGDVHWSFHGEVLSDLKRRPEGARVKHRVKRNWLKMYDKQQTVLRVETVVNDPSDFKVYRAKEGDPDGVQDWRRLRKGVADVHRRAEVSQRANERSLESLATGAEPKALAERTQPLAQPVTWKGRRARGLQPLGEQDARLLAAVNRGEFLLNGFRNRDLRPLLCAAAAATPAAARRQSAAVTRQIRLLRAHGLIQKVSKTHRYLLTDKGRTALAALLAARAANTTKLLDAA